MNPIWHFIGKPLAMLGGRSWEEVNASTSQDCNKSISVGLLCVVSLAVVCAGHYLFWGSFASTARWAWLITAVVSLVLGVMYRTALRAIEVMSGFGKAMTLSILAAMMAVNGMIGGHELVLVAFLPQVEAQAKLDAARGITDYNAAVESSLDIKQLRDNRKQLDQAIGKATADRARLPDQVVHLQAQHATCEGETARRLRAIPGRDDPGHNWAYRRWAESRELCKKLAERAAEELRAYQAPLDAQLKQLINSLESVVAALEKAGADQRKMIERDSPALVASATTGFARHKALWAAVKAKTIPLWAALGLIFLVLAADAFSFVLKMLMRNDAATTQRTQAAAMAHLHEDLTAAMVALQGRLISKVISSQEPRSLHELKEIAANLVIPSVAHDLRVRTTMQTRGIHPLRAA